MDQQITRRTWMGWVGTGTQVGAFPGALADSAITPHLSDYASLRTYTGSARAAYVTGVPGAKGSAHIAGFFTIDEADSSSADDGGATLVSSLGRRWKRQHLGRINVLWFGAVGDGINDDTVAIRNAVGYVRRSRKRHAGMVWGHSIPDLEFPGGFEFLVTRPISLGPEVRIQGNRAIITSGSRAPYPQKAPLFSDVGGGCLLDGLVIFGFSDVVTIATGNVDASTIDITGCEFHEWNGHALAVDGDSASTLLRIRDCKFYPRLRSATILKNWCDRCEFSGNWVEGPCDTFFWNKGGLRIDGMLGVPTAASPDACWVRNEGSMLVLTGNRFGGEAGARTLVEQRTGPGGTNATQLVAHNNEVWTTGRPVISFHDIPDVFVFEGNYGLNGALPFRFNAIPQSTRAHAGARNAWRVRENQHAVLGGQRVATEDAVTAIKMSFLQTSGAGLGTATVMEASVVRNILHTERNFMPAGSISSGMHAAVEKDLFGAPVQVIHGVDGTSNFNTAWKTLLKGLPVGTYTLLVNFEVGPFSLAQFNMHASQQVRQENVGPGRYTLALPFFFDDSGDASVGYSFINLRAGARVSHGGLRVVAGRHDGYKMWNTEVYGSGAPSQGYWRVTDRVIESAPRVGRPTGWVCISAGTPGTWLAGPNW